MLRPVWALIAAAAFVALAACGPSATDSPSPGGSSLGTGLTDDLAEAALAGNSQAVESMLAGIDVNAIDPEGRTALMLASFGGHSRVVQMLCENQANPNLRDINRRTALMYAATGPDVRTVEILLAHGAEVNVTDGDEGWTALMFAAAEGHLDVVRMLLDRGADPGLTDSDGESALVFASQNGHDRVVALLQGAAGP